MLETPDLDDDGDADLLLAGPFTQPDVLFGLNDGDGTFSGPTSVAIGVNTVFGETGDFDGDGVLDLVLHQATAGPFEPGAIAVRAGLGDGTFGAAQEVLTVPLGTSVRVADMDGDGFDDLLVSPVVSGLQSVDVHLSNGDSTFAALPTCADCDLGDEVGATMTPIDADGDGDVDVALPGFAVGTPQVPVRMLLNDGTGALVAGPDGPAIALPTGRVVTDVDGDGRDELVVTTNTASGPGTPAADPGEILVLAGQADGSLALALVHSLGERPASLTLGDFDGDGRGDLASVLDSGEAAVVLDHTYGPDEPFVDLGQALPGLLGFPIQLAEGTLVGGTPFVFRLAQARAGTAAFHVVGFTEFAAPFKGGVLVPAPDLLNGPLTVDASGDALLAGTWPPGDFGGLELFVQFWIVDAAAVSGFAASSAVKATLP